MIRTFLSVLAMCACLASATEAAAQTPTDTSAIIANLVGQFDSLHVRSVAPARYPREPHERAALLVWTAKVAAVAGLDATQPALPVCLWGRDPVPASAGYMLRLSLPVIYGARAQITVARECDNPNGYVHDVYGRGETYHFEHREGVWQLTRVEHHWVT
jgi:hypothetical protein